MENINRIDFAGKLLFVGGPPRSGTTFLAQSLNLHPRVVTVIDDHVFECWGLYNYRSRRGLVDVLRKCEIEVSPQEAQQMLWSHLIKHDYFKGLAKYSKQGTHQPSPPSMLPYKLTPFPVISQKQIYQAPVKGIVKDFLLSLKSPEITYVLPELAKLFPKSRFLLVYRPLCDIAESMYRKGNAVKRFPVFFRRWQEEVDKNGTLIPPPGIPQEWYHFWPVVSDFQRCVINAAAYMQALVKGIKSVSKERFFLYEHTFLLSQPEYVFAQMEKFLELKTFDFSEAKKRLETNESFLEPGLINEFVEIVTLLRLESMMADVRSIALCDQKQNTI